MVNVVVSVMCTGITSAILSPEDGGHMLTSKHWYLPTSVRGTTT
jgi:hypothetical protein